MKQQRQQRIDHEIQRELARIISLELKDPRLGFVTVTRVEVTTDLHTAKVFVSIIGDRHVARQSMDALKSAAGYMRGELGAAVKLRHTPELVFVEDRTTERAIALSGVLAKAAAKEAATVASGAAPAVAATPGAVAVEAAAAASLPDCVDEVACAEDVAGAGEGSGGSDSGQAADEVGGGRDR